MANKWDIIKETKYEDNQEWWFKCMTGIGEYNNYIVETKSFEEAIENLTDFLSDDYEVIDWDFNSDKDGYNIKQDVPDIEF